MKDLKITLPSYGRQYKFNFPTNHIEKLEKINENLYLANYWFWLDTETGKIKSSREGDNDYRKGSFYVYNNTIFPLGKFIFGVDNVDDRIAELKLWIDGYAKDIMINSINKIDDLSHLSEKELIDFFDAIKIANAEIEQLKYKEKLAEDKIKVEKQAKINLEILKQSTKVVRDGGKVDNNVFYNLLKYYDIKVPIRTKGWILSKLISIEKEVYRSKANSKSSVVFKLYEDLQNAINKKEEL